MNRTSFIIDGMLNASERQLKKGMIILVNGTISKDYKTNQIVQRTALNGQGNPQSLTDLRSGNHLQTQGLFRGGNTILATEVERSAPASTVQIRGLVIAAADPFPVLFGSSIDTSVIPESGFLEPAGSIGRNGFFADLSNGKTVVLRKTHQAITVTRFSASRGD